MADNNYPPPRTDGTGTGLGDFNYNTYIAAGAEEALTGQVASLTQSGPPIYAPYSLPLDDDGHGLGAGAAASSLPIGHDAGYGRETAANHHVFHKPQGG